MTIKQNNPSHRQGFTLVEALVAAVILAMAVAAILMPFSAGAASEMEEARRTLSACLAQELMEEILSRPFTDPLGRKDCGPDAGMTSRFEFDNIDDYDGYSEPTGQIIGADGELVDDPAAAGLSRSATATYVYLAGQESSADPTFIRIVVEVRYRNSPVIILTRLVYSY